MTTTLFSNLAGDLTGEPGRRPPLVLLHGLTFDRTSWHPVLAELATLDPGRQVLALDLPGHGESPPRPGYDLEPVADAVHRAVAEAGLSAPVLAGHSAGGVIATIYAARYPARGVVNVDQPLRVEPFAQLVRSLAGPLRGPGFAQVWAQFEASMGIGLLPQDAQDLLQSARYVRQDLVTGYWRGVLDEPPGELALVAFAAAPASWLLARGFSGPLSRAADAERAASGSLASAVEESLANQALIQAFNRQDAESRRLHREGMSWLRATMAETKLDSLYEPLVYFLETCCVLLVFAVGAWDVAGGRLSLAGLLAFAACLAYLYPPVQSLSGLVLSLSEASASAARIGDILGVRPAVADEGSALRGRLLGRGRIDVEDVTFGYPGSGRPVLDRLCFTAAPGRLLAITGPSGAGKSTVARLLLRFRDPDAGRILLDGIDLRELSLRTLRYNITLLTQETLLFPGTVADNIRYGRSGASDNEVAAAARAADAHAFITALPDGYDTPAGQRGRLLSGGQRQRICLARAFLRDAPVLVLDEPTTGLDAASAQRLLAVIRRFAASHTVILITHDPRLTAAADTVLHLAPASTQSGPGTSPSLSTSPGPNLSTAQAPGHTPQPA